MQIKVYCCAYVIQYFYENEKNHKLKSLIVTDRFFVCFLFVLLVIVKGITTPLTPLSFIFFLSILTTLCQTNIKLERPHRKLYTIFTGL